MSSIIDELETDLPLASAILGDVSPVGSLITQKLGTLVAGQTASLDEPLKITTPKGIFLVGVSVKISSNQDVTNPSVLTIFADVVTDSAPLMAGSQITLPTFTEKLGNAWIDETFTLQLEGAAAAAEAQTAALQPAA